MTGQQLMLFVVGVSLAGCATTGLSTMRGKQSRVVGYASNRSDAILQTMQKADQFCRSAGHQAAAVVREETVYQGQLDQRVGAAAEAFGRVASAMGNTQAGQAGAAVGSPTDYRTTVEFVCQ